MKIVLLICFHFLFSIMSFGQPHIISGIVTDSENKQKLSYASIMMLKYPLGTTTDLNGFFELTIPDSLIRDTVLVSYVGYKSTKISISGLDHDTIALSPQAYNLLEIVVNPASNRRKKIIVNQFNKNDCSVRYTLDPFNNRGSHYLPYRAMEPSIEAIYFPYKPEYKAAPKLEEIWVFLRNYKSSPTFCRLRIFNSNKFFSPERDLLTEPIDIIVSENDQLIKINLEKYNLTFSEPGIFVGVELFIIPINARIYHNNLGDSTTLYSPFLNYIPTNEIDYKFWLYSKGRWIEQSQPILEYTKDIKNLFYKPAISVVLSD